MQLQGAFKDINAAGLGVVVVTYDPPAVQREFAQRFGIAYPLLSDLQGQTVAGYGVLNIDYAPGDAAYGVAHPGVFVIDRDGVIVDKIFLQSYMQRLDHGALLRRALSSLHGAGMETGQHDDHDFP